jgi:ACS family hexuronate transporter-like MFS transporter
MGFPKVTGNRFVLLQTEARTGHILKKDQSPYTFAENSDVLFTVCDSLDEAKKQANALVRRHPSIEVNIYNAEEEVVEVIRDEMFLKKAVKFTSPQTGNFRWMVAVQLFFAVLIAFVVQNVLSVAIADESFKRELLDLASDMNIDASIDKMLADKMRSVEITFAVALALGFALMGWIADTTGTRRGMGAAIILASMASIAGAFVSSTNGLHVSRFVMGLGIGGIIPAALKGISEWFPNKERGWATGILGAGILSGWLFTTLTIPFLLNTLGWFLTFITAGTLGIVWIGWWYFTYQKPEEQKRLSLKELEHIWSSKSLSTSADSISWIALLKYPQLWTIAFAFMLTTPLWLLWIELPDAFRLAKSNTFSVSLQDFTFSPSFAFFAVSGIVGALVTGWLSINISKRLSLSKTRRILLLTCAFLPLTLFSLYFIDDTLVFSIILGLALAAHQGWFSQLYTLPSDFFPSERVASVAGICCAFGVLGGMVLAYFAQNLVYSFGAESLLWLSGIYLIAFLCLSRLKFDN